MEHLDPALGQDPWSWHNDQDLAHPDNSTSGEGEICLPPPLWLPNKWDWGTAVTIMQQKGGGLTNLPPLLNLLPSAPIPMELVMAAVTQENVGGFNKV